MAAKNDAAQGNDEAQETGRRGGRARARARGGKNGAEKNGADESAPEERASPRKPRRRASWGGRRPGAGRKPKGEFAEVAHGRRPALPKDAAVLITLDLAPGLPDLSGPGPSRMLAESLADANGRFGLELLAHSLHPDHLHLLVRARDRSVLSRGMTGLCVRMARGLNTLWRRGGVVFADRYEARALRTPRELRAARRTPCAWRTAPGAPGPKRPTRCARAAQ